MKYSAKSDGQPLSRRSFLVSAGLVVLPMLADDDPGRIRRWLEGIYNRELPARPGLRPDPGVWDDTDVTAAWIGHSTVLINFFGTVIITDPVLSDRVGPEIAGLFVLGPQRIVAPALAFKDLPPVDLILISHVHMDHCDLPTLERFPRTTPVVLPSNTAELLSGMGFERVYELEWGSTMNLNGTTVESLEVEHSGARYPWNDDYRANQEGGQGSSGYLLKQGETAIVFAGDTGYHERFGQIHDRGIGVDLAILPIGGYIPHRHNHCDPEEALAMADQMNARSILPVHWGTFPGEEGLLEPIRRLRKAVGADDERIGVDQIGGTWSLRWGRWK